MPTPTIPPSITPPPVDIPQRGVRTTFSARVDAFISWWPISFVEAYALVTNAYNNAVIAYNSATSALADMGTVAADKAIVIADMATVAADKAIVIADMGIVAADKAIVIANAATSQAASDKAALWADSPAVVEVGRYSAKFWADQSHAAATGQLIYRGQFSAAAGTYPSVPTPITGDFYKISVAGTLGGVAVMPNDDIIYNGATWDRIDNTNANKADLSGNAAQVFSMAPGTLPAHGVRLDQLDPSLFYKLDPNSPVFIKTASGAISIKAGTSAMVFGVKLLWVANTSITMPALTGGTDYAVYVCTDGTIRADASFTAPTGYTIANSRKIGGFHYGLVAPGTTVASGSFQTAAPGMVWTQPDVDLIAGIDAWSLWDLRYRPCAPDPRGFKRIGNNGWLAAYYLSTDPDTNGVTKFNTNVASGTVLPKIPLAAGGNGAATYAAPNWWDFNEILMSFGCRFPTEAEFNMAAFGTTEGISLGGAASTIPSTARQPGYTSKFGIEQVTGHQYIWGQDSAGTAAGYISNGGRGQSYASAIVRVLLGGDRYGAAGISGSRDSDFSSGPGNVHWSVSVRAACDHLQLG